MRIGTSDTNVGYGGFAHINFVHMAHFFVYEKLMTKCIPRWRSGLLIISHRLYANPTGGPGGKQGLKLVAWPLCI